MNGIALLFTLVFLYIGFNSFSYEGLSKMLYHSDFFINYEGGFVRRGLDGEFISLLSSLINVNPITLQKFYNLVFFLAFVVGTIFFLYKKKPPFYIMFSCSVLLLYIMYMGRGLRKDHIILCLFYLLLLIFKSRLFHETWKKIVGINFILVLGILIHEIFFLIAFFPISIYLNWLYNQNKSLQGIVKNFLYILPSFFAFIIVSFFFAGNQEQESIILSFWKEKGLTDLYFNSGIFNKSLMIWDIGFSRNQYFSLALAIGLHFIFVWIGIGNDLKEKKQKNAFTTILVLQYIVLILLSITAKDFSRWVFLSNFTSIIFIYSVNPAVIPEKDFCNWPSAVLEKSRKLIYLSFALYFINTLPHSGWSFNDYVVYNPVNVVYKTLAGKKLF